MLNELELTPGVLIHTCDHSSQQWRLKDCKLEIRMGYIVSLRVT